MHDVMTPTKQQLAYDRGRKEIITAASVDEIKHVRDKVEALRQYWKQRNDREMEVAMAALRLRADYQIGVLSAGLDRLPPPGKKVSSQDGRYLDGKFAILERAGIDFQRALENEKLKELLTDSQIEQICQQAIADGIPPRTTRSYLAELMYGERRREFHKIKNQIPSNLHVGDFRDLAPSVIPDASIDLVFIDPPWDRDALELYGAAGKEAARILKPGGSMICYCGQAILPEALTLISAYLRYFWIGGHVRDSGHETLARVQALGIIVKMVPLLWFVKEFRADTGRFIEDSILTSSAEKQSHSWQQAIGAAKHFIAGLTGDNATVVDFFAGGGTTIAAAIELRRQWIAFEIDEIAALGIIERLKM